MKKSVSIPREQFIKLNKEIIAQRYDEYNALYFGNLLPKPRKIGFKRDLRYWAYVYTPMTPKGKFRTLHLCFCQLTNWTEEVFKNTLLHEMIHIEDALVHGKSPKPSHGEHFFARMKELNDTYGLAIKYKETRETTDALAKPKYKMPKTWYGRLWKWFWG